MAKVLLAADDVPVLNAALPQITISAPSYLFTDAASVTTAAYIPGDYRVPDVYIVGTSFTFDAQGRLTGGTVTSVRNCRQRHRPEPG